MTMTSQQHTQRIQNLVRHELERGRLVETIAEQEGGAHKSVVQQLAHRQQRSRLSKLLNGLHAADLAQVMESLSREDRLTVWEEQAGKRGGNLLLELSDIVAEQIIQESDPRILAQALMQLNADEIAYLGELLPVEQIETRLNDLDRRDKAWLRQTLRYESDSVGALMDQDMIHVRDDATLQQVLDELRDYENLPSEVDKLFVTDQRGIFKGLLRWHALVANAPAKKVSEVMIRDSVNFMAEEAASDAARAFERYNLVSAPVLNHRGRLIGRLNFDDVMDFVRDEISDDALNSVGLQREEDLFAPVWQSARNRWLWLSLSLLTAFAASRVIGLFEETIVRYVALAALMPIVAAIGGNTGNQTTTLVVRGLALSQIDHNNVRQLIAKEMRLSVLNGLVWGSVVGLFALVFYQDSLLMVIIAVSMMLTLLLAAILGLAIPLTLQALNRDPALGSGVLVTALTDSLGFFIFLGLAAIFI